MIIAPVECNWRDVRSDSLQSSGRGSGSILSPRGAMSLLSVISPRRWSLRSNNKDKVRIILMTSASYHLISPLPLSVLPSILHLLQLKCY